MTVDISALSWMIRRMDVSSTLKTFTASFAFFTVLLNIAAIYIYVVEVLTYDFDLSEAGFMTVFVTSIVMAVVSAFTPLAFIFWDWVARQPWRFLAAANGALLGALVVAGVAAVMIVPIWFAIEDIDELNATVRLAGGASMAVPLAILAAWLTSPSERVRNALKWIVVSVIVIAVVGLIVLYIEEAVQEESVETRIEMLVGGVVYSVSFGIFAWLIIRAIRHRIILSANRPRELFLGALHRKGFWVRLAFLTGLPSSLWNLRALRTIAFWAFLLARPLVYGGLLVAASAANVLDPAIRLATGASMIVGGHLLFYIAKRLAALYAWNPDNPADSRPPILFLRSFEDDQLRFRRPWWSIVGLWFDLWSFRRNADEALIDEIAQYGPVLALGQPGQKKVPFGARRYYSDHKKWQDIVTKTAKEAQAIVIAAGSSPGVLWEYDLLARENLHGKTLLLFPPSDDDDGRERNAAALKSFTDAVAVSQEYSVPEGKQMIALLPSKTSAPTLLMSVKATASAYVGAARGFFQQCTTDELADTLVS